MVQSILQTLDDHFVDGGIVHPGQIFQLLDHVDGDPESLIDRGYGFCFIYL